MGLPGGSIVKNPPANAGHARDTGLIPGSGRSSGEGNGNPLQYSCWEIPWEEGPDGLQFMQSQESDTTEGLTNNQPTGLLSTFKCLRHCEYLGNEEESEKLVKYQNIHEIFS